MQRRNFGARALAGGALLASLPLAARAAEGGRLHNVVFTKDDYGHWSGMESLHVPELTLSGQTLTVRTPHPMSPEHYIVSHTVVLADGTFLSRRTFAPTEQPVSTHTLPGGYKGEVRVTSTCNQHDFWLETLTV
ncbi:MAG TPA: desulfoferrodoxin family protein [Acidocella sp.]|jgi:superoxide reductase|nr:desulfoferrodoxin family protein [Acidocella sp.]